MSNLLGQITYNFKKCRKELEKALAVIESGDIGGSKVNVLQSLNITDEMAEVFRDKPVFIIQAMDVRILQVNNQIQNALRALDKIDSQALRVIGTKSSGAPIRDKDGRFISKKEIADAGE